MQDSAFEIVRAELLSLDLPGVDERSIAPERSLIDDIGVDSLKFVDLTVGLERALGIDEFPMQEWVDRRVDAGLPLTVGALADACRQFLHSPERSASGDDA